MIEHRPSLRPDNRTVPNDVGYALGIEEGVLPKIRGFMLMLYAASTAFLFYAAVLEPHNLKPAYLKFLTRLTQNNLMAVLSKLRGLSLPYNCYEIGHTWTPDCREAALSVGFCVLVEAMKLYAPLYLASQLVLKRKYPLKDFLETLHNISVSSCFLGFHTFAFLSMYCLFRKYEGKFYVYSAYIPAFVASFLSILIEKENRRGPLALYAANVASQTLFRMATARGLIKPVKNGEVLLFSASIAIFLYIVRRRGFPRNFVSLLLQCIFGKEEAKQQKKSVTVGGKSDSIKRLPSSESISSFNCLDSMTESGSHPKHPDWLQRLWKETKHKSCPHNLSCMHYSLKGFLHPFVMGYLVYSAVRCLSMSKRIFLKPSLLKSLLTEKKALNLGLFLGGFGGTFRTINCLLRWCFNKDQPLYALPAAFLGGLFMKFFPSSTLASFIMWKLVEVGYALGIEKGILPNIRGSLLFLYAASCALLIHTAIFEAHNLKPTYLNFLNRITHNAFDGINRQAIDIFGTHASKMYPNVWPEVDWKYTSKEFQERMLIWQFQ